MGSNTDSLAGIYSSDLQSRYCFVVRVLFGLVSYVEENLARDCISNFRISGQIVELVGLDSV